MSIIHEALRRAEDQRRGNKSGLTAGNPSGGPPGRQRQTGRLLAYVGIFCLCLSIVIAIFSWLQFSRASLSRQPSSQVKVAAHPTHSPAPRAVAATAPVHKQIVERSVAEPSKDSASDTVGKQGALSPSPSASWSEPGSSGRVESSLGESVGVGERPSGAAAEEVGERKGSKASRASRGRIWVRQVFGSEQSRLDKRRLSCLRHLAEGQRLLDEGDKDAALEEFRKAVGADPQNEIALLALGSSLLEIGRSHEAEVYLRKGIELGKGSAGTKSALHANLGLSLFRQGRIDQAVRQYQIAIALFSGNLNAYNNLAIAFKRLGRRELARRTYSRMLLVDSKAAIAYYGLGLLCDEDGESTEAIFNYSRFLVLAGSRYPDLQRKVRARVEQLRAAKAAPKSSGRKVRRKSYLP